MVKAGRGEGWLNKWRRKDGSYKGKSTGVDRDASNVKGIKRGSTRRVERRQKRARGVGMQGPT